MNRVFATLLVLACFAATASFGAQPSPLPSPQGTLPWLASPSAAASIPATPASSPAKIVQLPAHPAIFVGCDDICTCNSSCRQGCYLSPGVPSTCASTACQGNC